MLRHKFGQRFFRGFHQADFRSATSGRGPCLKLCVSTNLHLGLSILQLLRDVFSMYIYIYTITYIYIYTRYTYIYIYIRYTHIYIYICIRLTYKHHCNGLYYGALVIFDCWSLQTWGFNQEEIGGFNEPPTMRMQRGYPNQPP